MHVAIDASSWANERGFGRVTRCLVAALAGRASEFTYTLLFDAPPTSEVPAGVEIKVADTAGSIGDAGGNSRAKGHARNMARAAAQLDCDLFYFPTVYSYFPFRAPAPKLIGFYDTIPERFPDLIFPTWRNKLMWKAKTTLAKWQATRVLTISEASRQDLEDLLNIPTSRIDIIPLAADPAFRVIDDAPALAETRRACNVPQNARLLVYVGGFNRHKNVIRLIEAMPAIQAAHPDVYLAIVGRVSGARFWDNVDQLKDGARDNPAIGFTGEIDDDTMARLLNSAEALVFPSLWEGFGLPAVEAMACGATVLSSDRGSLPEVVGDCGLYYDPTDSAAIAAAANRLLSDPALLADLKSRAPAHAATFTWDRAAEMAEEAFRKTISQGRSS